jgi:hypothetical protein
MMCDKYLDLKKAVKSAIVLYALVFTFVSALTFYVPPAAFTYAALLLVAVLTLIVAKHYFRMYKPANPICSGLALGMVFAVVTFVLDVLLMVYGFASYIGWSYFASASQMLGYVLTVVMPVLAAKMVWGRKAGKARRRRR